MSTPADQLFTIAGVDRIDQQHVRIEHPVDVGPDDRRVFVWAGSLTRLTFESADEVEEFALLLLDRLSDLRFGEHVSRTYPVGQWTPEALDRLLTEVHGQPVETAEVTGDVL